jgi:phosphoribosylanthranilate isomerase
MALSTFVIVNGINNLSDARYCAGMGVDFIGFNLEAQMPGSISVKDFKEISGWVSGVQSVGEFTCSSAEEINAAADTFGIDLVQLNNLYLIDEIQEIKLPIIQRLPVNKDTIESELIDLMELYQEEVKFFLINSDDFTTIDETNEAFLKDLARLYPLLIGFGIAKENVRQILRNIQPDGIGLSGGTEIKPGFKDFDALQAIFEELEVEED